MWPSKMSIKNEDRFIYTFQYLLILVNCSSFKAKALILISKNEIEITLNMLTPDYFFLLTVFCNLNRLAENI
jgi:hypothetical protein